MAVHYLVAEVRRDCDALTRKVLRRVEAMKGRRRAVLQARRRHSRKQGNPCRLNKGCNSGTLAETHDTNGIQTGHQRQRVIKAIEVRGHPACFVWPVLLAPPLERLCIRYLWVGRARSTTCSIHKDPLHKANSADEGGQLKRHGIPVGAETVQAEGLRSHNFGVGRAAKGVQQLLWGGVVVEVRNRHGLADLGREPSRQRDQHQRVEARTLEGCAHVNLAHHL
mmetsp:Transcript_5027/g.13865  ORF Transcript_5027/g.13865 Transcript_5027/m.13865 type:complete len:223 (+) Transcript_5027:128-796(+)